MIILCYEATQLSRLFSALLRFGETNEELCTIPGNRQERSGSWTSLDICQTLYIKHLLGSRRPYCRICVCVCVFSHVIMQLRVAVPVLVMCLCVGEGQYLHFRRMESAALICKCSAGRKAKKQPVVQVCIHTHTHILSPSPQWLQWLSLNTPSLYTPPPQHTHLSPVGS